MKFITIYVTHSNRQEAQEIVHWLLHNRLIACVNYFPIQVEYHWKWVIENDDEVVSWLKTKIENWDIVKEYIESHHPYETPCIIKTEVEGNDEYVKWIYKETQ